MVERVGSELVRDLAGWPQGTRWRSVNRPPQARSSFSTLSVKSPRLKIHNKTYGEIDRLMRLCNKTTVVEVA